MHKYSGLLMVIGLLLAGTVAARPLIDGSAAAGKKKSAVCAGCHGVHGNSTSPQFPKLAGQHATYLYAQLLHFKTGKRDSPIMQAQVAGLSKQDMKDLAVYYSKQQMKPGVASKELLDRGAKIYRYGLPEEGIPACAGCHGPSGLGNAAARIPRISSQHAKYLIQELKAFRSGKRSGYPKAEIMVGVTQEMTDRDIKAVATYLQGLQPRKEVDE